MSVINPDAQNNIEEAPETIAFTNGACINNGQENACTGSGMWYGENDPCNLSVRVAYKDQSNQIGELVVVLLTIKNHPPNEDLCIVSDLRYVINGITKHTKKWEERGWIDVQHKELFQCIIAWMRSRKGKMKMKWVKGHNGTRGNEEANKLASEGVNGQLLETPLDLKHPPGQLNLGASIAKLEQRDFYQILNEKKQIPTRKGAERNVGIIQACAQETFEKSPTTEDIWLAMRHKDFTKETQDFLWKCTQSAYKIGEFWNRIDSFKHRGICPTCNEQESLEHILTMCDTSLRKQAWKLANDLWRKWSSDMLPTCLGDIIGCSLTEFKSQGKPDRGKNRLYQIIVSETAYLIWKMRNERRIRDGDMPERLTSDAVTTNRWTHAINKRLTIDRTLTNNNKFGKKALNVKTVKGTWKGCLKDEEDLPTDWFKLKGVLVGIASTCPPGHVN